MSHKINIPPISIPDPPRAACAHGFRNVAQYFVALEVRIQDMADKIEQLERMVQKRGEESQ